MDRRQYLSHLGSGAIMAVSGLGVLTSRSALAATRTITVPAEKFFAYLKNYYDLPPAERTFFRLAYFAHIDKARPETVNLSFSHKGKTQGLTIGLDGILSPLPSAEAMRDQATLSILAPEEVHIGLALELIPALEPQADMALSDLVPAVVQAAAGAKKAAGLMAMVVPNYDSVMFQGVASGEVVLKDGTRKPLPLRPAYTSKSGVAFAAVPYLTPARWPEAKSVQFPATPHFMTILPAPKAA